MTNSLYCVLIALWLALAAAAVRDKTDETRLIEAMMMNYNPAARPVYNASHTVVVKFGITLTQISDMDEVNQVLTINVWLEQEWTDERLTWDPKGYNNLKILRIPCEKLWLPDIVLYNSADDYTTGYMNSKAMVSHDGNVFWPPPAKFRSSCKIDITYFPFDDQTCELKFGSWTYDGFQVDITNRSSTVDLQNYVFSGEWELMDVRIRRTEAYYNCCMEPYPDVRFTIVIRRKTLYYLFNIIFPCLWLTILSLLGFWLPPDSGEKITLGITVLLAFSVFMLLIAESMPATSEFVPLIGIYLTVTMGMTSLSIILTVFVLQLHHVGPHKRRVPRWLKSLVFGFFARVVCMRQDLQNMRQQELSKISVPVSHAIQINESAESSGSNAADCLDRRGFHGSAGGGGSGGGSRNCNGDATSQRANGNGDRVAPAGHDFSIQTVGYQGAQCSDFGFQSGPSSSPFSPNFKASFRSSFRRDQRFRGSFRAGFPVPMDYAMDPSQSVYTFDPEFDKYQELVSEWQFVAHVMDRLLFWLFLFVAVVSSLAILVIKPLLKPAVV
ncbi:neuronal acetylcholine receptor subunit alpha-10-like isoform X3 [Biomphalaria glabrata]|uniref:Neuronal acetylcholine receptor subunit alpha-10-like isoform X3 n=1 Tax=Biomphalaria glabrata TaxID=6526 RepID=A0A9W2ZHJ4_BIOGL|nr:neuronal acetylcholine receptor subunit alpha-10-like isoform X3 [Biomphalaria glabrata]XP_055874413.1 neuronal acetylcholine receptor subunit alpha-10-like isoform X3 [Biomphalaria glabrata]XP_055874414.1 neuronal acetylcholine receptor subunit alpha-10-like isoform X3 [Biomphalaria glabrata]